MKKYLLIFQSLITLTVSSCATEVSNQYFSHHVQDKSSVDRNVAFGALLPLRFKDKLGRCETPAAHKEGFLWLSALNYAVDDVNRKWKRTLNTSLTLKIRDTCNDEQIALEQALDFANGYRNRAVNTTLARQENVTSDIMPVLGVISAFQNQDASTLLSLFKVPQIIFGRGKTVIKNSKDILRSVSVGFYKARALADLVKYFTWNAVSVVYSSTNQENYETFLRISNIENLCIAVTVQISAGKINISEYESVVDRLLSEPQSTVVILFTGEAETKALLQTAKDKTSISRNFVWILTNDKNFNCLPGNPEHDTFVLLPQFPFIEGFRNYFENRKDDIGAFSKVFEAPIFPGNCLNSATFDSRPKRTKEEIQGSMNSVYLLARAYETASQTRTEELDRAVFSRSLEYVHDVLYSQNWKLFSGQRCMKENMFSLIHVRSNGSVNSVVNVGTWDSSWYINHLGINWSSKTTPRSSCGVQCSPGYIRVLKDGCKCCWSCLPCHYNQIVTDEFTCADCLRGYWPNEDFTKCEFQWKRTLFDCTLAVVAVVLVFSFMVL